MLSIIFFYDCQSSPREEVEEFFASMDRDFDGRLSFEEFMGEVALIQLSQLFQSLKLIEISQTLQISQK